MTVDAMVKTLLDSAPLYVEIWEYRDGEFRFMDCNERAVTVFGVSSKQDVMDLTFVDRPEFQPSGRNSTEMIYTTLNHVLKHGHGKAEFTLMNAMGEEMPFEFTYTRISLSDRQIIVCYGYDLREAIAAREEALENIKTLTDGVPIAMQMHDEETVKLIDCNAMVAAIFGYENKAEYMAAYNEDFYNFAQQTQPCGTPSHERVQQIRAQLVKKGYCNFEWMHLTRMGEELLLDISMVRVKRADVFLWVSYLQDLLPLKEAEARRVAAEVAVLEREKRFKDNILATISHELRTPLAVMSVYAEMAVRQIKSGTVTEEALAALDTISDESHRLASLASSALDMFVKKAADETKAPVDIGKMVAQLVGILDSMATKRGVKIHSHLPQNLPLVWAVSGDITRVFWNILDNALRYTKNGTIDISAMSARDKVIISIADSGCGMDNETKSRAFDRGFGEGSGLGLVFCKEIIETHGGEISIESELGAGTSVIFSILAVHRRASDGRGSACGGQ